MKKTLTWIMAAMSIGMIGLVIITSLQSSLWEAWERLKFEPWFTTTLVDFYFNITIISAWVIYKEGLKIKTFLWIAGFILLGSIATAFYVFWQCRKNNTLEAVLIKKN